MESRDERWPEPVRRPATNPPAFNVPAVILAMLAVLLLVHVVRTQFLDELAGVQTLLDLSFIAGCYEGPVDICRFRAEGADLWSPFSHALLHGDWTHLGANALWLLAFGTPVARRIGTMRFLLFSLLGAASGAALFYVLNPHLLAPMIGASGVVSAVMGGASRFALGSVGRFTSRDVVHARRLGIVESLTNRTILFFVAVFFATNILIGSGLGSAFGADLQIAWEAHLGGFAFGFLAFAAFDRRRGGPVL